MGLSATVIALSVLCLKAVGEAMTVSQFWTKLGFGWAGFLCASIGAALSFQMLHYAGYRQQATQYFPPPGTELPLWKRERRMQANRLFGLAERAIALSLLFLLIGAVLAAWLWLGHIAMRG